MFSDFGPIIYRVLFMISVKLAVVCCTKRETLRSEGDITSAISMAFIRRRKNN